MSNQRMPQGYRSRSDVVNTIKYGPTAGTVGGRVASDFSGEDTESLFGDATLEFSERMTQQIKEASMQEKLQAAGLNNTTPIVKKIKQESAVTLILGEPLENCKLVKLHGTTATIMGNETENMSKETFDRLFNIRLVKSKKAINKERRKILLIDLLVSIFVFALSFIICRDFGANNVISAVISAGVLCAVSALVFYTLSKNNGKLMTASMALLVLLTVMGVTSAVHSYFFEHTAYLKVFIGTLAVLLVSLVGGIEITSGIRALFSKSKTSELDNMFKGRLR